MTADNREGPVDRRTGTYEALEKHVDEHIRSIEERFAKWLLRGLLAFSVIALACAASLVGFGILLGKIQDTRAEFVRNSCEAQNKRHDKSIAKFNEAANASIKRNPQFADEIEESRAANVSIIEALAPKQDCDRLSKVAVGKEKPPPPDAPPIRPEGNP